MKTRTLTAIIHKEEDMYVAECPEVGTVDQGETIEEALANLKEATRLYLKAILRRMFNDQRFRSVPDLSVIWLSQINFPW